MAWRSPKVQRVSHGSDKQLPFRMLMRRLSNLSYGWYFPRCLKGRSETRALP